jgi:phosphorylcholine metabolism protein LicD
MKLLNLGYAKALSIALILVCATPHFVHAEKEEDSRPPENFVRDTLAPTFLPIVTGYHHMRESVFLNTKAKNASGLEAVGNAFLAPSRFLFGGKTVQIVDETLPLCTIEQSFKYEHFVFLKTIGALIALPFSEALGSACKGLALLAKPTRERHKQISQGIKASYLTSQLDTYRQAGISSFHEEIAIPCQGHKRPSHLSKKQQIEIEALREVIALFEANNILYWIDCGTCLGAYRYGGIIPWDWDIDIAILLPDHENVKRLLSQLDQKKYQIQDWSSYSKPKTFLKLFVKATNNFIDIYHYKIDEENKQIAYLFTLQDTPIPHSWKATELKCTKPLNYEDVFPLKKATFDGLSVWAPNHVETFLKSKYGENLDPAMIWDEETHSYQKVTDHPYWASP